MRNKKYTGNNSEEVHNNSLTRDSEQFSMGGKGKEMPVQAWTGPVGSRR